jgi:hypothetical protein
VVNADLEDVDSLRHAFEGAHGAYCVTNYGSISPATRDGHAHNMAKAAKQAGVKHAIWSTLEDVRKWYPLSDHRMPTIEGKWKCPHFDAKGASDHFFSESAFPPRFCWRHSTGRTSSISARDPSRCRTARWRSRSTWVIPRWTALPPGHRRMRVRNLQAGAARWPEVHRHFGRQAHHREYADACRKRSAARWSTTR